MRTCETRLWAHASRRYITCGEPAVVVDGDTAFCRRCFIRRSDEAEWSRRERPTAPTKPRVVVDNSKSRPILFKLKARVDPPA